MTHTLEQVLSIVGVRPLATLGHIMAEVAVVDKSTQLDGAVVELQAKQALLLD